MHIGSIEIKGFGKLKNRSFSFGRGMNVIYGVNEAGKSTIQSFITAMFYGLKGGRSSGAGIPSPQKRFMPWDGLPYGGAIIYTVDSGDSFRIERDFSRNTIVVYDSSYNDITSSFNFGRDRLPMVGEAHLGMDESTFESTVLIRQMEVRLDNGSSSVLAARLVNMDSPDIDGLVFQRAEAVLTNAVKNKVGTERSRTQPLDKLQSELKRLETEYKALAERQREKEKLLQELSEIKAGLRRLEAQEHRLVKIGELIGTRKRIDDGMKKEARLSETVKQISEIESTIGKLHSPDDSGGKTTQKHDETGAVQPGRYRPGMTSKAMIAFRIVLLLLCAAVLLASAVLMFAPAGSEFAAVPIPPYVYAAAMPICVLIGAMLAKGILDERKNIGKEAGPGKTGANNMAFSHGTKTGHVKPSADGRTAGGGVAGGADVTAGEIGEKLAALETAKRNLLSGASMMYGIKAGNVSDVRSALDDVRADLERLSRQLQSGLEEAAAMDVPLPGIFSQRELDELIYDSDINWLEDGWKTESESLRRKILDTALREKYCEGQLDEDKGETDRMQRVEEEIAAVREKIGKLENTGKALKLALEVLTEAAEEIRLSNAPELNNRLSVIISGLTGGRYTDLRGDNKLLLKASDPQQGDVRNVSVLSGGTADQMYLALRLAVADMLTSGGESLPLVMDEVFSQFDDKRTELALKYLYRERRDRQILLFTCKMREVELAREIYGNEMYFVEL